MNLLLLESHELDASGTVELTGRRAVHIARVLRAAPGDVLRLGVIRGPLGRGRVVAVEGERVRLAVELDVAAAPPPLLELILAVPRPKVVARVIEVAASFGVGRIDLVNAWRVDKSYFGAARIELARLREHAWLGCEQGGHTWLPELALHRLLMPFFDEILPRRALDDAVRVVAHPREASPLEAAVRPGHAGAVVVAIGPEGGWIDREIASFREAGFVPVSMGAPVLRVEAAVAGVLAQLELLRRLPASTG